MISQRIRQSRMRGAAVIVLTALAALVVAFLLNTGVPSFNGVVQQPPTAGNNSDVEYTDTRDREIQSIANQVPSNVHNSRDGLGFEKVSAVIHLLGYERAPAPNVSIEIVPSDSGLGDAVTLTSDANGQLHVPDAALGAVYTLTILTKPWRFLGAMSISREWVASRHSVMTLRRLNSLSLEVKYADGVTYQGYIEVAQSAGGIRKVDVGADGKASFLPDSNATTGEIRVRSRRVGFEDIRMTIDIPRMPSTFEIVMPFSEVRGGILVAELQGFDGVRRVDLTITGADDPMRHKGRVGETQVPTGQPYRSPLLVPGTYVVTIRDASLLNGAKIHQTTPLFAPAWQAVVEILDGAETVVEPMPLLTSGVKAKILASDGTACFPAILATVAEAATSWQLIEKREDGYFMPAPRPIGVSNTAGVTFIYGLIGPEAEIVIDAMGYESRNLTIQLRPGELLDVGTITLNPAKGEITVEVERQDRVVGAEYEVLLLQTGGRNVMPPVRFVGERFVLDRLDLRRYTVSLRATSSDVITNAKNVVLDQDAPTAVVTFRMRPVSE
jgi:hypothetical protein